MPQYVPLEETLNIMLLQISQQLTAADVCTRDTQDIFVVNTGPVVTSKQTH